MKPKKLVALLSLAALLLSSCTSGGESSSPAPDSPAATAEPAAVPQSQETPAGLTVLPMDDPMAGIDDSLSFSVEPDINSDYEAYTRSLKENFKAAYLEKLSSYFADMEIDDMSYGGNMLGSGMTGWFIFTGTPSPDSGIEPREQYCRSFNIRSENEGRTLIEFQRSWPMEPAEYLSQRPSDEELLANLDTLLGAYKEKNVKGLVEAELYVRQLDSRYILTDSASAKTISLPAPTPPLSMTTIPCISALKTAAAALSSPPPTAPTAAMPGASGTPTWTARAFSSASAYLWRRRATSPCPAAVCAPPSMTTMPAWAGALSL